MIAKLQSNRVRRTYLGGSRIDAFTGTISYVPPVWGAAVSAADEGVPRPEDWLASTTTAFNGTLEIEGEGLGRLEDGRFVKDVVGPLPILVKLLDSDERLVIQAHPTVACAKRLFGSPVGKTECWYFLEGTAEDACVYLGFKPGMTRELWEDAFEQSNNQAIQQSDKLLSFLHRIPVKAGDFVFVDGGMPHAIGGGCFMVELQEPSDLMVVAERVTPSGRRIPDAKMHGGVGWDKMFDVYEYEGRTFEDTCAKYVRRAAETAVPQTDAQGSVPSVRRICGPELTDKFTMWRVTGGGRAVLPRDRAVAVVTGGDGEVNGLSVKKGDRLLIADDRHVDVSGNASLIVCA